MEIRNNLHAQQHPLTHNLTGWWLWWREWEGRDVAVIVSILRIPLRALWFLWAVVLFFLFVICKCSGVGQKQHPRRTRGKGLYSFVAALSLSPPDESVGVHGRKCRVTVALVAEWLLSLGAGGGISKSQWNNNIYKRHWKRIKSRHVYCA